MYIDWVGDQPELLVDAQTGELRKVHIFVTTVGVSSMIYAEAFPDEKLPNFIAGTVHALDYYGAIPKYGRDHFMEGKLSVFCVILSGAY